MERPVAVMPELPDPDAVREWHEKNALRGVGTFNRAGRAAARQHAAQAAQAELNDRWRRAQAEQAQAQQVLDSHWARLIGNDPATVLATLAEAYEDNEAPAAPRRIRSLACSSPQAMDTVAAIAWVLCLAIRSLL